MSKKQTSLRPSQGGKIWRKSVNRPPVEACLHDVATEYAHKVGTREQRRKEEDPVLGGVNLMSETMHRCNRPYFVDKGVYATCVSELERWKGTKICTACGFQIAPEKPDPFESIEKAIYEEVRILSYVSETMYRHREDRGTPKDLPFKDSAGKKV